MSKADEMFKKLGYRKNIPELEGHLAERKENDKDYDELGMVEYIDFIKNDTTITFNIWYREVEFYYENKTEEYDLRLEELQAINEKCKELGWI